MNQVNYQFTFPIPCFDGAVQDIDTEANYFIAVDMDSGYCQVVVEEMAQERLELFIPDGKWRRKLMPMGALNKAKTFVAMAMKIEMEWNTFAKERGLKMLH